MKKLIPPFVSRLKKQKEDGLDHVLDMYLPLVKAIVYKVLATGREADREECVNDVFLVVWQNAKQFEGDEQDFKRWIGTIAKYKAIDRYRKLKTLEVEHQNEDGIHTFETSKSTYDSVLQREQKNALLAAISQLPETDRDIFLLKYFMDFSNNEVAEQLGLSKAAVDNRLYRGKKTLSVNRQLKELLI